TGEVAWVPDAPGADLLVVLGVDAAGAPVAGVVDASAAQVEAQTRYAPTRSLGHARLEGATGRRIDGSEAELARAWHLAQALLARPPARRSTSPRARTSSRTAGSGRRGSTTRRSSSAARSCPGDCSAERATPPTAWRRSCSRRPDRREQPARRSPGSALAGG